MLSTLLIKVKSIKTPDITMKWSDLFGVNFCVCVITTLAYLTGDLPACSARNLS